MDAIQDMVLKILASREKTAPASKDSKPVSSEFKDMLKQELERATTPESGQPADGLTTEQPPVADKGTVPGATETEGLTAEQQSMLAALLMQPAVVVPLEETDTAPTTPLVTAEIPKIAAPVQVAQEQTQLPMQTAPQAETAQRTVEQTQNPTTAEPVADEAQPNAEGQKVQPLVRSQNSETDSKQDETVLDGDTKQEAPLFRELEGRPVKVGETVKAETPAETVDTQVDKAVQKLLSQGESRVTLQLTPENLGKVMVEVTRGKDGSLQVLLTATTEKAAAMLERGSGNLQNLLMGNNQNSVQIEVQRHQESQQSQNQPFDQNGGGRQGEQQERHQPQDENQTQNFIQQLRLGLVELDDSSAETPMSA